MSFRAPSTSTVAKVVGRLRNRKAWVSIYSFGSCVCISSITIINVSSSRSSGTVTSSDTEHEYNLYMNRICVVNKYIENNSTSNDSQSSIIGNNYSRNSGRKKVD